jgi:hypothetical protein
MVHISNMEGILAIVLCVLIRRCCCAEPLAFVHIPKTGGSSITAAFERSWNSLGCSELDPRNATQIEYYMQPVRDVVRKRLELGPRAVKEDTACLWTHLHAGPTRDDRMALVQGALRGEVPPITFVVGHMPHGICQFMREGCRYATVLRDPVDRVLSHYHYLQYKHPGYLKQICDDCETVDGFARELAKGRIREYGLDNLQTRFIAGDSFWSIVSNNSACLLGLEGCDMGYSTPQMLRKAMAHLRQYAFVGIMEDMAAFGAALDLDLGHLNKGKSYTRELSPETANLLRSTQTLDIKLYTLAVELSRKKPRNKIIQRVHAQVQLY